MGSALTDKVLPERPECNRQRVATAPLLCRGLFLLPRPHEPTAQKSCCGYQLEKRSRPGCSGGVPAAESTAGSAESLSLRLCGFSLGYIRVRGSAGNDTRSIFKTLGVAAGGRAPPSRVAQSCAQQRITLRFVPEIIASRQFTCPLL
jgi:hypothetical protein